MSDLGPFPFIVDEDLEVVREELKAHFGAHQASRELDEDEVNATRRFYLRFLPRMREVDAHGQAESSPGDSELAGVAAFIAKRPIPPEWVQALGKSFVEVLAAPRRSKLHHVPRTASEVFEWAGPLLWTRYFEDWTPIDDLAEAPIPAALQDLSFLVAPLILRRMVSIAQLFGDKSANPQLIDLALNDVSMSPGERERMRCIGLLEWNENARLVPFHAAMLKIQRRWRTDATIRTRSRNGGGTSALEQLVDTTGGVTTDIAWAALNDGPVLIRGESGTGKELVAQAVHELSDRWQEPFYPVNVGSISEELASSLLFGHEAGAFTGAHRKFEGAFRSAGRGTLFLDEIGDSQAKVQVDLLRVLQERKARALGGEREYPVTARILAATNRPIESLVEGGFRRDLLFRLNPQRAITLRPLRERTRREVREIWRALVGDLYRNELDDVTPDAAATPMGMLHSALALHHWEFFESRPWVGNIRELKAVADDYRRFAGPWAARDSLTTYFLTFRGLDVGGAPPAAPESPRSNAVEPSSAHDPAQLARILLDGLPNEAGRLGAFDERLRAVELASYELAVRDAGSRAAAAARLGIALQALSQRMLRLTRRRGSIRKPS